jgi:hypothetical protein
LSMTRPTTTRRMADNTNSRRGSDSLSRFRRDERRRGG